MLNFICPAKRLMLYEVEKDTNRLKKVDRKTFSELGLKEVQHLQEWIANCPDVFEKDLLIIQKEFAGFEETQQRLDLLAMDKDGCLVVIENKGDDTEREALAQAIQYASYVSSLRAGDIVEIFQNYLDKSNEDASAEDKIREFLGLDDTQDISDANINEFASQRVILIAAHFRKELLSAAHWLLDNGINAKCFQATLYCVCERILVDILQVVPASGTEQYSAGMSLKGIEKKLSGATKKQRLRFWQFASKNFKERHEEKGTELFDNITPQSGNWLDAGSRLRGCPYRLVVSPQRKEASVSLYMGRSDKRQNKRIFDYLYRKRSEIEAKFGSQLVWERLDAKKASRVKCPHVLAGDFNDRDSWPAIVDFFIRTIGPFEKAFKPHIDDINKLQLDFAEESD